MKRKLAVVVGAVLLMFCQCSVWAQQITKSEEIEWTWEVRPVAADPKLPNVLLLGDSITRAYFPEVKKELAGVANVYLMASSTSVGDPRLERQIDEFKAAERVEFAVVHFNNGMHGWEYSEEEYKTAFGAFVGEMRAIAPKAKLIWAPTTPVRAGKSPGPTNARVAARNAIAAAALSGSGGGVAVDDQFALMRKHGDLHQDDVHFNDAGAALQGKQAAEGIRRALGVTRDQGSGNRE